MAFMIQQGDQVPESTFITLDGNDLKDVSTEALFGGSMVLVIGVVGAFTPVCSGKHLPEFIPYAKELKENWLVQKVVCISVADPFTLKAWATELNVGDSFQMLTDTNAEFAKKMGLDIDLSSVGLGVRSTRYVMLVNDGKIVMLNVEDKPQEVAVTSCIAVKDSLNGVF